MKYVSFGRTGIELSRLCLGTMMFGGRCDETEADAIVGTALEGGVNFLDTAAMYGDGLTEAILGRILKGRRDKFFVTTKVHAGVEGATIRTSIEESLARLQTDHADLYLIHWPASGMHPVEMMQALNDVVISGKTRFIGVCNFPAWLFAHLDAIALANGWARPVCNQVPYNLIERGIEVEILPQAVAENIAITTYRVMSAGLLAGKYTPGQPLPADARGQTDERLGNWLHAYGEGLARFLAMARERGVAPGQLATAWVYGHPGVAAPIVGVSSRAQLASAVAGFSLTLDAADRAAVSGLFDTEVKEVAGGRFPGLRRQTDLVSPEG